MPIGAPKENKNAEKWSLTEATELFNSAINLSLDEKLAFDFIGEVARELKTYRDIFTYLKDKFPKELKILYKQLNSNLEANCFSHTKKGDIIPSAGIINLKSNHGWTDRVDTTTKGETTNDKVSIKFK